MFYLGTEADVTYIDTLRQNSLEKTMVILLENRPHCRVAHDIQSPSSLNSVEVISAAGLINRRT